MIGFTSTFKRALAGAAIAVATMSLPVAPALADPDGDRGADAMMGAVMRADAAGVRRALAQGVSPEIHDSKALLLAAHRGHDAIIRVLVEEYGANPDGHQSWPLAMAAQNGHIDTMKLLKKLGADVNGHHGWALANATIVKNRSSIVALLDDPDLGADINAGQGLALACAIRTGDADLVRFYLHRGADSTLASVSATLDEIDNDAAFHTVRDIVLAHRAQSAPKRLSGPVLPAPGR